MADVSTKLGSNEICSFGNDSQPIVYERLGLKIEFSREMIEKLKAKVLGESRRFLVCAGAPHLATSRHVGIAR